jgi:hypothetical protein
MKPTLVGVTIIAGMFVAACTERSGSSACHIESVLPEQAVGSVPRDRLPLGQWMLILPVDANGGRDGVAASIFPADLEAGYSSEWFFATDDGGIAFWAPVNGATTPNSAFARSELRHLREPDNPQANWAITDTVSMTASLTVSQVASADDRVVVGKLVGFRNDEEEYPTLVRLVVRLHDTTCRASLFALVSDAPRPDAPSQQITLVDDAIRPNQRFGYSIALGGGVLTLRSGTNERVIAIDQRWSETPVYFMAGAALTVSGTDAADGGSVTFYDVVVTQ